MDMYVLVPIIPSWLEEKAAERDYGSMTDEHLVFKDGLSNPVPKSIWIYIPWA